MREIDVEIGQAVRLCRRAAGLSRTQLIAALAEYGIKWDHSQLSRVETGNRKLTWEEGWRLGDIIQFHPSAVVSPDYVREAMAYRAIAETVRPVSRGQ